MPIFEINIKVFRDPGSPFVHFHYIANDEVRYHSASKMIVIPPMEHETIWNNLLSFLETKKDPIFELVFHTDKEIVTKINPEDSLILEGLIPEIQGFFDNLYPAFSSGL